MHLCIVYVHVKWRNLTPPVDTHCRTCRNIYRTGQTFSIPPYSSICAIALQEGHDNKSSCFSITHKSELRFKNLSEAMLIKRFNPDLNQQDASTKLNIFSKI